MSAHPHASLALFLLVAVAFPLAALGLARLWFHFFQPARPGATKQDVYECGVAPTGDSWIQFKAHYYLYALLFLEVKLYGEAGLQLFFIAMAAWGWWSWQRGTGADGGPLRVRRLRSAARGRVLLLTLLAWPLLGLLLQRDRKSTRLNSSHVALSRMPSSA